MKKITRTIPITNVHVTMIENVGEQKQLVERDIKVIGDYTNKPNLLLKKVNNLLPSQVVCADVINVVKQLYYMPIETFVSVASSITHSVEGGDDDE